MNSMFDTLLLLPLFQGMAHEDFSNVLEKVRLHFVKHKNGEVVIAAGDYCDQLVFALKGEIMCTTWSRDAMYSFSEYMSAPCLLEPQALQGVNTSYVSTYTALGEAHTVSIGKSFVLGKLFNYEIFRLNYTNLISNRVQCLNAHLWLPMPETVEARIARFILHHCERNTGKKVLKVRMEDLARLLNETRQSVSKALNNMQDDNLLELRRGKIVVFDAARLQA